MTQAVITNNKKAILYASTKGLLFLVVRETNGDDYETF